MARKSLLWILAVAVMGAACGGSDGPARNPAGPTVSAGAGNGSGAGAVVPAGQGGSMVARDVTGGLSGRFDFTQMWGDEWWQFYSDSTSTGTLTHLGLSQLYTRHLPNLVTGALEQGEFRITAANGDEIRGTYEGQGTYDPDREDLIHGVATFVITEGTGRFAGATGTIAATFLEVLDDSTWASAGVTWTLGGMVTY
ncbi:MAG: hypothetical protein H6Q10_2595 [Acidobacteria bacterium]|nr:hypothetical protein [Acidobacteriota bacterium]